jgi:hypothetical protein
LRTVGTSEPTSAEVPAAIARKPILGAITQGDVEAAAYEDGNRLSGCVTIYTQDECANRHVIFRARGTVTPEGSVSGVDVLRSTGDRGLDACMSRALKRLTFERAPHAKLANFRYTLDESVWCFR